MLNPVYRDVGDILTQYIEQANDLPPIHARKLLYKPSFQFASTDQETASSRDFWAIFNLRKP